MTSTSTLNSLYVVLGGAPGGTATYIVRKNGVNTSLTVTLSGASVSGSDIVDTVPVTINDLIALQLTTSGITPTYTIATFNNTIP